MAMKRISRKAFAAIKTAQDDMRLIQELGAELKVTNAYNTAKAMLEIANKYMADFEDCDPYWTPAQTNAAAPAETAEAPAEA